MSPISFPDGVQAFKRNQYIVCDQLSWDKWTLLGVNDLMEFFFFRLFTIVLTTSLATTLHKLMGRYSVINRVFLTLVIRTKWKVLRYPIDVVPLNICKQNEVICAPINFHFFDKTQCGTHQALVLSKGPYKIMTHESHTMCKRCPVGFAKIYYLAHLFESPTLRCGFEESLSFGRYYKSRWIHWFIHWTHTIKWCRRSVGVEIPESPVEDQTSSRNCVNLPSDFQNGSNWKGLS